MKRDAPEGYIPLHDVDLRNKAGTGFEYETECSCPAFTLVVKRIGRPNLEQWTL
jgi:hypothetical protein